MRKKRNNSNIVGILVFTLITLSAWVGFELYRALTSPIATTEAEDVIFELNPVLDTQVLDMLEKRHP